MVRREDIHPHFAVVGPALEAMLNTFRGQFWLQAVFRQKANDFAKRSRPDTDIDKHITIGGRPHVGAPVLQAVEHYHQPADQAPAIRLRLLQVE